MSGAKNQSSISSLGTDLNRTVVGYFFYGDGCSHCDNIKPFISEIQSRYPDLDLEQLEVYHNATNQALFLGMDQSLAYLPQESPPSLSATMFSLARIRSGTSWSR